MIALGKESSWTWRKFFYLLVAGIAALVLLSWMHGPVGQTPAVPNVEDNPFYDGPSDGSHHSDVEPEKEEAYIHSESLEHTTSTAEATTSTTSAHSNTHATVHTPSPSSKSEIPMFNGEIADGLTEQQCQDVFPDLYLELDRRVDYWKERGHTISKDDVEISYRERKEIDGEEKGGGAMRILIHNNEIRILESVHMINHMGYRGRGMGSLQLIERALASAKVGGEMLPTIEAAMIVEDDSSPPDPEDTHSFWTYAQNVYREEHNRVWLMPNFDLWYAWPMGSYEDARRRAMQHDANFTDKIQKLVWRGGGWNNWELRGKLVEETEDKDWADVAVADWGGRDSEFGLSQEALCKYAMTVHTEGVTYSGRLKFLLNCNSLLFVHDLEWVTYYTHLLQRDGPNQNYVNVKRDWSDLEEKVKYYFEHPDEAERIINNAVESYRKKYLTKAATSCYIRRLIKAYASVAFTPEVNATSPENHEVVNLRGKSFQRFMDGPDDFPEQYFDV